ncbi:DUF3828 domain-containing protein [Tsuneonella suprasediminis]|uniref:DUF3828 domain-containing protein n=1 Tax=Tsuneonella suprasediminis TaxID=2306996 RepID=UPI002F943652
MIRASILAASLALAVLPTAAVGADNRPAVQAALALYDGYRGNGNVTAADWELPVFSADLTRIIAAWMAKNEAGDVTELSDFGWFCECQDWDQQGFKVKPLSVKQNGDHATIRMRVRAGWGSSVEQRLTMVRENGRWLLDDMTTPSMPNGLRAALHETLSD